MKSLDMLKQSVFCVKRMSVCVLTLAGLFVPSAGAVTITGVTAQQRYPWNGLVDIVVTINGTSDDAVNAKCTFTAADNGIKTALTVAHINGVAIRLNRASGSLARQVFSIRTGLI